MWNWITRRVDEAIAAELADARLALAHEVDRISDEVSVDQDHVLLAPNTSFDLVHASFQTHQFVDGVVNFNQLKEGDVVGLTIQVKFPDSSIGQYLHHEQSYTDPDKVVRIPPILAPRGISITAKHLGGRRIPISYFVVRSK